MLNVTFITSSNTSNGVDRVRVELPVEILQQKGFNVNKTHAFTLMNGRIRARGIPGTADIIVFKSLDFYSDKSIDIIKTAQRNGQIIVCDIDDDIFNIPDYYPVSKFFTALKNKSYLLDDLFDYVIASTPPLQQMSTRSVLIPNSIKLVDYKRHPVQPKVTTIGYFGLTFTHRPNLLLLKSWLNEWLQRYNIKFIHIGSQGDTDSMLQINSRYIKEVPMIETHMWPWEFYKNIFDISLIPMVDTEFDNSKSNLKGMESAAFGMPFIVTPIGEYVKWNQGMIKPIEQWEESLTQLLDYKTRVDLAEQQYQAVQERDINKTWIEYLDFFEKILLDR